MASNKRDKKGRVLRPGETQQKNGCYRYTYYVNRKQHCFYSWKLEDTDRLPQGKRQCESLRSQIKVLQKSQEQGIAFRGRNLTVAELVQKHLEIHDSLESRKHSAKVSHEVSVKHILSTDFASKRIDKVKKSDAKLWVKSLQEDKGLGFSTIASIIGVVRCAFRVAVDDDLLIKNPFDFTLTEVVADDSSERYALTAQQKASFLEFIENDRYYRRYYDAITILFETGMRIAEFCGLTIDKVDMQNRTVKVDCQLHYDKGYVIEPPKSKAGNRTIPMTDVAHQCFQSIIDKRKKLKNEPMIDGKTGYLMFDNKGKPRYGAEWNHIFNNICAKYNSTHEDKLPDVTPHICRHTFATEMACQGMNPFILKEILGHEDIAVTNAYYIHINDQYAADEMERLKLRRSNMNGEENGKRTGSSSTVNPKIIEFGSWIA